MGKNYGSLNKQYHDVRTAIRDAYDKGYEQGRIDYERKPGQWTLKTAPTGGEYECSECGKRSMAPGYYCQYCGSKMVREVLIEITRREVKI